MCSICAKMAVMRTMNLVVLSGFGGHNEAFTQIKVTNSS